MPNATTNRQLIPMETISRRILLIRGQKVMLDADLAALYEVSTGALNQAVRRNLDRFPPDFMFQLNKAELRNWKSQIVISNPAAKMAIRKPPLAFTEQGVAMLSSVLHSRRAVQVNIAIMRAFVQLRLILATHRDLAEKLRTIEKKYDKQFKAVFEILRHLMSPLTTPVTEPPKRPIGFSPLHKK
jgi:hypothetical protein